MIKLIDEGIEGERERKEEIFIWGAGNRLELVYEGFGLENRIAGINTRMVIKSEEIP